MIQGSVESVSRDQTGFKVNGQWYNVAPGTQPPQRGAQVQFEPQPDGRGFTAVNLMVTGAPQGGYGGRGGQGGGQRRGGGGGRQKSPREVYGPIVGHNLLIAATILGPGASVTQLVDTARQIMGASEGLLNEVLAQHAQGQQQSQQYQQYPPQNQQYPPQGGQAPQHQQYGPQGGGYQQGAHPQNNGPDSPQGQGYAPSGQGYQPGPQAGPDVGDGGDGIPWS